MIKSTTAIFLCDTVLREQKWISIALITQLNWKEAECGGVDQKETGKEIHHLDVVLKYTFFNSLFKTNYVRYFYNSTAKTCDGSNIANVLLSAGVNVSFEIYYVVRKGRFPRYSEIRFTCDYPKEGLEGPSSLFCNSDGHWSGNFPICGLYGCYIPLYQQQSLIHKTKF